MFSASQESPVGSEATSPSIHTDPNYKENLKLRFVSDVLPTLSKRARDAWTSNQKITEKTHFKEVTWDMIIITHSCQSRGKGKSIWGF